MIYILLGIFSITIGISIISGIILNFFIPWNTTNNKLQPAILFSGFLILSGRGLIDFGRMHMLKNALYRNYKQKFLKYKISLTSVCKNKKEGRHDGSLVTLDQYLEGQNDVVILDAKFHLQEEDIENLASIVNRAHNLFPDFKDKRIWGAIGYVKADREVVKIALKANLFVITNGQHDILISRKR